LEGKLKKTELPFLSSIPASDDQITVIGLSHHIEDWLIDCEGANHSPRTVGARRMAMDQLLWFLNQRQYEYCDLPELRRFFAYLNTGHNDPGGRWGNPRQTKPLRPATVQTFFKHLRTFFNWMVKQEIISASPMRKMPAIIARPDQIQPFTQDQVLGLLNAAKQSQHRHRDAAILWFLFDTGLRASEICGLKMKDVDFKERKCLVLGKGNKYRAVPFGRIAGKELWQYVRGEHREPNAPVFISDRGTRAGDALTRGGLLQLVERLGRKAGIERARCCPHTFRHTFAIEFLRNGGNIFTLKEILGHTSLHMTNRYVAFAQADIVNQHRQFSPADRLRGK
jgi:site-specific recombinase XerD